MKKLILLLTILSVSLSFVYTQDAGSEDDEDKLMRLTTVRLSGFEDASFWRVYMPIDQGIIVKRSRIGAPMQVDDRFDGVTAEGGEAETKAPNHLIDEDNTYGIPRNYARDKVLGVKVMYISRGHNWFTVSPIRPIVVEGISHSLSVFVAGRNYRHFMKARVLDFYGNDRIIPVGYLNHPGWKRLTINVPGERIIKQWDHRFMNDRGIKFNGFLVECEPSETFGTYYLYFDELRARTDIFSEQTIDKDDMADNW